MKHLFIATAAAVGLVAALPASAQTSTVTTTGPTATRAALVVVVATKLPVMMSLGSRRVHQSTNAKQAERPKSHCG